MNAFSDPTLPLALALPILLFLALWAAFYLAFGGVGSRLWEAAQRASVHVVGSPLGRWTVAYARRSRLRPYAAIFLVLVMGGVTAIGAGASFANLAEHFRLTTSSVYHVDHAVNTWFQDERHLGLTVLLRGVTTAGGPMVMGLLATIVVAFLLLKGDRATAVFIMVTGAGGALLNLGLKMIFARARPTVASAIAIAQGYSFPSGHAMGSIVVLGSIGYVLLRQPLSWRAKSGWFAILVTAVLLIGLSRVYLGVHWVSDIAAGWSAGTVWLASGCVAFETLLRLRRLRSEVLPSDAEIKEREDAS
jgi:membrane-associated phospholipid phosphatase